jgi:hypothetical protein
MEIQRNETLMRQGNISLILASYDDIFSDFDPRPFSQKALSDDFLSECRKASHDKIDNGIDLRLLVPKNKRKTNEEAVIKNRILEHFHKHSEEKMTERKKMLMEGMLWVLVGVCLSLIATAMYHRGLEGMFLNFLFVLMEPAGWFLIWIGLEKLFLEPKEKIPDYEFYIKMSKAQISFHSY